MKAYSGMYSTCIHLLLVKNICLDLSLLRLPQKSSLKMSKLIFFYRGTCPSFHSSISPSLHLYLYPTTHHPSVSIIYALDICWVPNSVVGVKTAWRTFKNPCCGGAQRLLGQPTKVSLAYNSVSPPQPLAFGAR